MENINSTPETVVGSSLKVEGDLVSGGDLRIDGEVKGNIKTEGSILVGKEAKIYADIDAANAEISGLVEGNLTIAGKTVLNDTANVTGKLNTGDLSMKSGARFSGECEMKNHDGKKDKAESHKALDTEINIDPSVTV